MWKAVRKKIYRFLDFFQSLRVVMAIKKGYIMTIPVVILGALSLVIVNFPSSMYQAWIQNVGNGCIIRMFNICNKASLGFLSLWLVISISFAYIGVCGEKIDNIFALPFIAVVAYLTLLGVGRESFSLDEMNANGMFIALVSSVITCELYLALFKINLIRKFINMTGVDNVLAGAIRSIVPAVLIVGLSIGFRELLTCLYNDNSVHEILKEAFTGLFNDATATLGTALKYLFLVHIFWLFGVHGNNVLSSVGDRIITDNTIENAKMVSKGLEPKHILTSPMINCFVYVGGTGAVLCLVIAVLIFIKRKSVRTVCKLSLIPSIFNISEVVTFGLPIVLNPILAIPFILVPIVSFLLTYFSMYAGIVPKAFVDVYWTTPVLVSGYESTGSIKGTILQIIIIVVGVAIYYPFLKLSANNIDRKFISGVNELKEELISFESVHKGSDFLERNNRIGDVARVLAGDLRYDIEHKKLFMAYQPQVNEKGEYIGAEALIRWYHPIVGFVYPPLIIALAKEAMILDKLERLIIGEVCKSVKYLQDNYDEEYKISANITAESLRYHKFEYMIDREVSLTGIDRRKLWFEITEQEAVMSSEDLIEKLTRLREHGHRLLIDDFGMGHTSVLYLQSNIFDYVKLDGSITRNILTNDRNSEIIGSIVHLSKTLDFEIISEYVETEEQKEKLRELGCNIYQGYLYSKPVRFDEFISKLDENREANGKANKKLLNGVENIEKEIPKEETSKEEKETPKETIKKEESKDTISKEEKETVKEEKETSKEGKETVKKEESKVITSKEEKDNNDEKNIKLEDNKDISEKESKTEDNDKKESKIEDNDKKKSKIEDNDKKESKTEDNKE